MAKGGTVVRESTHWLCVLDVVGALGGAGASKAVGRGVEPSGCHRAGAGQAAKLRRLAPHHLRHTAAALLWAAGVSDIEVQLILGHVDIETSRRLYAHLLSGSAENGRRQGRAAAAVLAWGRRSMIKDADLAPPISGTWAPDPWLSTGAPRRLFGGS